VPRLLIEDLKFCKQENICFDCYQEGGDKPGVELQTRKKLKVPCCRKHFYAYKKKINQAEAKKYARSSAEKRQMRQCTYKGCHRKLIPQELLPPWIKETTCGMHGTFKAFRVNRNTILRLITEYYLTPEERKSLTAQNVIYKPGESLVWFSAKEAGFYVTKGFSTRDLLNLHKKIR
jgi:hypothetical protein